MLLPALLLPLILVASQATDGPRPLADPDSAFDPLGLPCTMGSTRGGVPLIVVSAPGAPWAVVQLHVRVGGEGVPPELRAESAALAATLAEGRTAPGRPSIRERVERAHGETRVFLEDEAFVVSEGVPAAGLEVALAALNERLIARRRLMPVEPAAFALVPETSSVALGETRVPDALRQSLTPTLTPEHPYTQSLTSPRAPSAGRGEAPNAARVLALGDLVMRREGLAVVVIGPEPEPRLRARVLAALRATPPGGARLASPLSSLPEKAAIADVRLEEGARGSFAWLWWPTKGLREATALERAALRTLASTLGAEARLSESVGWLSWHIPLPDPTRADDEEARRSARLSAVAEGTLADDELRAAAVRTRTARLLELALPEGLARALGAEALAGKGCTLGDELAAYGALSPADVRALARALLEGGRVSLRGEGPPLEEGS